MKDPRELEKQEHLIQQKKDPLSESFKELQLSEEAVAKFDDYCADIIPDAEYFSLLPEIDFRLRYGYGSKPSITRFGGFGRTSMAIVWLMQKQDFHLAHKFLNLLFAIGGETVAFLSGDNSNVEHIYLARNGFYRKAGMTKAQIVAVEVAAFYQNRLNAVNSYHIQKLDNGYHTTEEFYEAMCLCRGYTGEYKAVLAALFLFRCFGRTKLGSGEDPEIQNRSQKIEEARVLLESFFQEKFSSNIFATPLQHEIGRCLEYVRTYRKESPKQVPWPADEIKRLKKERFEHNLFRILCVIAYAGQPCSDFLQAALLLLGQIHREEAFRALYLVNGIVPYENFIAFDPEKSMLVSYLNQLAHNSNGYYHDSVRKFFQDAKKGSPEEYGAAIQNCDLEAAAVLMNELSPEERKSGKFPLRTGEFLKGVWKTIVEVKNNQPFEQEIMDYLEERISTEQILPVLDQMAPCPYRGITEKIELHRMIVGPTEEYKRTLVLMTSNIYNNNFFFGLSGEDFTEKSKERIEILYEMLPMKRFFRYLSTVFDCYWYSYQEKAAANTVKLFWHYVQRAVEKDLDQLLSIVGDCPAEGRAQILKGLVKASPQNVEKLLGFFGDSSKTVKAVLLELCGETSAEQLCAPAVLEKLKSRKSAEREMAVQILVKWGKEKYRKQLEDLLATEKSGKIQTLIREALAMSVSEKELGSTSLLDYINSMTKGNKKASLAWIYQTPCCIVHKKDGSEAPEEWLSALMLSYSTMSKLGINPSAAEIAAQLNSADLEQFAEEVFEKWMAAGAESKKKWVLYFASIHGGIRITGRLKQQIQEWPRESRGAIAAEAVWALSLNPTDSALLIVDSFSRKFKFRQVKNAAADALVYAAKELGITTEQLADRIVPDLGFDKDCSQIFDYGTRKFTVYLNPALELEIYDEQKKKLKNLPAPGKRDKEEKANAAYAQFKLVKKEMKTAVATQKLRLELALATDRRWTVPEWKALFVNKPVMHQFAIGLVWGMYEGNTLLETFRYMEDGTFNTREQDEYCLEEAGENKNIGLVHPVELTEDELAEWKEQLEDYEVIQPFEQLDRPVYVVTEEEKNTFAMDRMKGRKVNGLSLSSKLMKNGWYRGSVQDAGGYYEFFTESQSLGIGAQLEIEGLFVGDENEETTIGSIIFYRAGTVERGSYVYDTVKESDRYLLGDVPKKYFSEILYQADQATLKGSAG